MVRPSWRTSSGQDGVLEVVAEAGRRTRRRGRGRGGRRCCARLLWRARPCGPRRAGRRRRADRGAWCGRGRRGVRRPWSAGGGSGRAGRPCGPDGRGSRSAPAGGTRRASALASFTTWNGSATWTASGSIVSNTDRYGPGEIQHRPARCASSQAWSRAASHPQAPALSRPATTSSSCPASTSTIDVDQRWRRHRPVPHEQGLVQPQRGRPHRSGPGRHRPARCRRRSRCR